MVYLEIPQEGQRYFFGSFEQIWHRELMARFQKSATNAACKVALADGIGQRDLLLFRHVDGAWRRDLSSYFVALLSASAFSNTVSHFYSQARQWPPNPYLTPSEVHLLLPDLDLGAFKPSRVRYASEAPIKAQRFLRLLPRKRATVPSCNHTINHYLSRRRVPLWELGLSSYRHKVHPMLM